MKNEIKPIKVIIPAAGKGSRLGCTDIPKAMYTLCEKPLIETVLENTSFIKPEDTYIIVGFKKNKITDYFGDKYNYIEQKERLGTGHAVSICAEHFKDFDGTVLVTFGDMPFFGKEILEKICKTRAETDSGCTMLTAYDPTAFDWAKVIRDEKGNFEAIVEGVDCTEEQNKSGELFAGVLAFDSKRLFETLPQLSSNNAQGEYYLTEVPELMKKSGILVNTVMTDDLDDLCGVNTLEDLKRCEGIYKKRNNR